MPHFIKIYAHIFLFFLLFVCFDLQMAKGQGLPEFPVKLVSVPDFGLGKTRAEIIQSLYKSLNINAERFSFGEIIQVKYKANAGLSFQLYLDQMPIQNGLICLSKAHRGKVLISLPDVNFQQVGDFQKPESSGTLNKNETWVVLFEQGRWNPFRKVEIHTTKPTTISQSVFYDLNGDLKFVENWLLNFHAAPDSIVKAAVFRPDPASKLRQSYGGGLRDRSDSNSVLLSAALDTVYFRTHFDNDTFQLKNDRFQLGEFSLPQRPLAHRTSPNFCFTRDNSFFEEVNVFYHLNHFRSYIDSLGFTGLADYSLKVDAHGLDGADQSAYSPGLDMLAYGIGNVDDGEDASVIVHEYGHALVNSASPFGNSGLERRALEEGLCDYLAGSYSRTLSVWNWQSLFKWDGCNEFWAGRNVLSSKHYPENLVGQIHQDGEIFSSALMHLELLIGREKTHKILCSTFSALVPNLSFRQAAALLLESDSLLFNGLHTNQMLAVFEDRGISPENVIVSNVELTNGFHAKQPWIKASGSGIFEIESGFEIDLKIEISDVQGRLVQQKNHLSLENGRLTISGLPSGFYVLRAQSTGQIEILRFVVGP